MMLLRHTIENRKFNLSLRVYLISALFIFLFAIVGSITWMIVAELSAASIAPGKLVTELQNQSVQHHTGGVIERLFVKEGDVVEQGDLLLTLSDPVLSSRLHQLEQKLFINNSLLARLDAEINHQPLEWGSSESSVLSIAQKQIQDDQKELLQQNLQIHRDKIDSIEQQINQIMHEKMSFMAWLDSDERSLILLNEELKAKEQLMAKGFMSKLSVLELRRRYSSLEAKVAEHKSKIEGAASKIHELNANMAALKNGFIQKAQEKKQEIMSDIQSLEQQLIATRQLNERIELRAPVSGEVINLSVHTQGGVVAPGSVIMKIVPRNTPVVASVNIHPRDIESVYEGLSANVRLSSFSFRKVPAVSGVLTHVSADSIFDQYRGIQVYQGKIALDANELAVLGLELKPGMPVQAHIILQERTVLDYLISPLMESMEKGMREI